MNLKRISLPILDTDTIKKYRYICVYFSCSTAAVLLLSVTQNVPVYQTAAVKLKV